MKRYNSISDVKHDYEKKQEEEVEIMPGPASQHYHEKLKRLKTPPSPSEKASSAGEKPKY
jgi:hypothetical protein